MAEEKSKQEKAQEEIWEDIEKMREAIANLIQNLSDIKDKSIRKEIERTLKELDNKVIEMTNQANCICDWEYGESNEDCMACLNQWRNERYGYDVHDVECVCNDCTGIGYRGADY